MESESRLPARSVFLPTAEVSTGHPHPCGSASISKTFLLIDAEVQCRGRFARTSFLIFDCNYFTVHFVTSLLFFLPRFDSVMYSSARRKNRHKKDRKIFIGTKEITVKICDLIFDSSSPAWGGVYEANNKLLENYSFRRFESGGIRKTANFVPCVLATKLTVKMAKTLDFSRVFKHCAL